MSPTLVEGQLTAAGRSFGLIVARFNHFIGDRLLEGALDAIARHGGDLAQVSIYKAPGGFELPLVAQKVAEAGCHDALVAIGAIIRGSTPHFEYVATEATKGLAQVSLRFGVPITFGLLTVDTIEQAVERAGTKAGNKGWQAAVAAIEMVDLLSRVPSGGAPS